MQILSYIVSAFHILFCVSIIVIVLLQSGTQAGLGAISGGAETFFGKNKGRTMDAMLRKYTTFAAIFFLVTSVVLQLIIIRI